MYKIAFIQQVWVIIFYDGTLFCHLGFYWCFQCINAVGAFSAPSDIWCLQCIDAASSVSAFSDFWCLQCIDVFGALRAPRACHAFMRVFVFAMGIHMLFVVRFLFRMFLVKCLHAHVGA